ncbi:MAG: dihydroorotate dehydrogenase electron transfer subunit [Porphyromonas sp.]|nr:dihydroorotate dehydrogenase electron transfer subunit [Porphyromonas sp.]
MIYLCAYLNGSGQMRQKYRQVVEVVRVTHRDGAYFLLELSCDRRVDLRQIQPGQFVEVAVPNRKFMLRRPISICDIEVEHSRLLLLIDAVGEGTQLICQVREGDSLDLIFPLGKGFALPKHSKATPLLIGGGVGIAPMVYLTRCIWQKLGVKPDVLLGAKTAACLDISGRVEPISTLHLCTDDGSLGFRGFVSEHPLWNEKKHSHVYVCGPNSMMKAIARKVGGPDVYAEFSLENKMACGIGACLCCVEHTTTGNRCVCTEGPVFNLNELRWLKQQ